MSESRNNFYFREDGKSVLVEFQHGNTDYKTVGRITFCPGHPGSMFAFEKVGTDDYGDFAIRADDLLAIVNKLTGHEKFPPEPIVPKSVVPNLVPKSPIKVAEKCSHCNGEGVVTYARGPYETGPEVLKCGPCNATGYKID